MTKTITFLSVNVCGRSSPEKRKDVLNFLKKKTYSIYLQDTHFTKKEENYIRSQWGFESFFSSFSSQSRGVAILFSDNFEHKLRNVQSNDGGNKLFVEISIQEKTHYGNVSVFVRICSVITVNYRYITVLCPFNLLIRFKCYNTVQNKFKQI